VLFDTKGNPVTVNLAGVFFPIPGSPTFDSPALAGTGFGGLIANSQGGSNSYARKTTVLGGSTGWLTTTVPVQPGEIMTIRYVLWDSSDHLFDSTAIIDNWQWLQAEPPIQTNPGGGASAPLPPSPPAYVMQGHFDRDYNAACPPGSPPVWGLWSWDSFAPSDSYLAFEVAVADTQAGLDSATYGALLFSGKGGGTLFSYPVDDGGVGYSGADDQVAQSRMSYPYGAVSLDTEVGSLPVDYALQKLRFDTISPWVRIRSNLHASTDRLSAPVLNSWSLTYDCPPSQ
jgi:hypothetical protein